jgi:hypothetical protein
MAIAPDSGQKRAVIGEVAIKGLLVSGLSSILAVSLLTGSAFAAVDQSFGTGSLIIPMDGDVYQTPANGGIYVAYGLIYKLLNRKAADGVTADPVPVSWIIDPRKTSASAPDLTVSSTTIDPVVTQSTGTGEIPVSGIGKLIAYKGGPFVIDSHYAAAAKAIWGNGFQNVTLHIAKIPFTASVQRTLFGTPPKIALMNDSEARTGNATKILAEYLQIAGIVNPSTDVNGRACDGQPVSGPGCVYDVLTPNEVGGIKNLAGASLNGRSLLFDYSCSGCATKPKANYRVLWVPHWTGAQDYLAKNGAYQSFNPAVGTMSKALEDVHDIVMAVRDFLSIGNSVFAECAAVATFEWSKYGRFLSKYDIGQNGGAMNTGFIYNNKNALDSPYIQSGSMQFDPQGGHLHNWRPYQAGDSTTGKTGPVAMAFDPSSSNLKSTYNQTATGYDGTVTVFTYDNPPPPPAGTSPAPDLHEYHDGDAANTQWHYFTGGNMDGDTSNGYVLYLGGHSYVQCGSTGVSSSHPDHEMKLSFNTDMSLVGNLSMTIGFTVGKTASSLTVSNINAGNIVIKSTTSGSLTLDLSHAAIVGGDITGIHVVNQDPTQQLVITSLTATWDVVATLNEVFDITENANVEKKPNNSYVSGQQVTMTGFTLDAAGYVSGCSPKGSSGAGVRYVLNSIFQLDAVGGRQFVRSAPVVYRDFLYQGSFEYPSFDGHFRKFQVNADMGNGKKGLKLDVGFGTSGDTAPLLTSTTNFTDSNANKAVDPNELMGRNIYASTETGLESGSILKDNSLIREFKFENANLFQSRMSFLVPLTLSGTQTVLLKRYGMTYDQSLQAWLKKSNVMGGIEHSAPVIIGPSALTSMSRPTMAYVGALDGMLHAFQTGVNTAASPGDPGEINGAGKEIWSFIPSSQLPRLQYFRDPNAISTFPAVDASLAYAEVPDASGQYITVLLATMGVGGNSLVALDVTNPTAASPAKPKVLWERSGTDVASGAVVTMGNGSKVAIGRVKTRAGQTEYRAYITTALKDKQACQDTDGTPLTDGSLCGGIQIYSFDLLSGAQRWRFQRVYKSGMNDIPGSLSLVDVDQNGDDDYVVFGDMEGNLWLLPAVPDYDGDNAEDTFITANSNFTDAVSGSSGIVAGINPLYAPSRDEKPCAAGSNPSISSTPCYIDDQDQPIGITPTVVTQSGRAKLVWGTGGAQWASDGDYYALYVLDITSVNAYGLLNGNGSLKGASLVYKQVLDKGEKVFGAVTYSEGYLYLGTAFGNTEDVNPKDDVALANLGNIRGVSIADKNTSWKYTADGKFRGSVFVARGQLYATTLDGKILDIGNGSFKEPSAIKSYRTKSWRQVSNLGTNQ